MENFFFGLIVVAAITLGAGRVLKRVGKPQFYSVLFAPLVFVVGYISVMTTLDCGRGACDFGWRPFFQATAFVAVPMLLLGSVLSATVLGHFKK